MANEEMPTQESTLIESSVLDEGLAEFYLSDTFSDVKLVLSDQDIYAHKIVLATKSKFFKSLLLKDPKQTDLNLIDVRSKAFKKVLRFIYTGSIAITTSHEDLIFDILKLSNKYCLETLEESVLVQVSSMLNMTNVCQILNEANSCEINKLRDLCHGFIDQRIEDVLESDFFNSLSEKSIIRLLERDAFSTPEIDVFKIVAKWCKENGDSCNLVKKVVRFPYLTEDEILNVVFPSELVDYKNLLTIIKSMKDGTIENLKDAPRYNSIFKDIEQAQKILEVSDRQLFKTLDCNFIEMKKSDLNTTNICSILNTANFYDSDSLRNTCYSFIDQNLEKFTSEDCFLSLTKKSLIKLFERDSLYIPEMLIFKNVLNWCKLNEDFDKMLIGTVRLASIDIRSLLCDVWSSKIVDCCDVLQAVAEVLSCTTKNTNSRGFLIMNQNIATDFYEAEVISPETPSQLLMGNKKYIKYCTSHEANDKHGIVVKLGSPSHFNHIKMKLNDSDSRNYKYYIEISLDQKNWRSIIDYRSFPCRSVQKLFFDTQIAQYIRIVGTSVSLEFESQFELVYFEAYFKSVVPRFINGIVCPKSNVVTFEDGAILLEGKLRGFANFSSACYMLHNGNIIIQLVQPYMISRIKFKLGGREWKYLIETSLDKTHWECAGDQANAYCTGWQDLRFKERPVVFIKITGFDCSGKIKVFCSDRIECFFENN